MQKTDIQSQDKVVSEIEVGRQRLLQRNWRFALVPSSALFISLLVLVWEIIRQNMPTKEWPWTIQLLGVAPAATLSGLFASLILAREQFARSLRPSLSWSCQFRPSDTLDGSSWTAIFMNFGPGVAHVETTAYSLRIERDGRIYEANATSRREIIALLVQSGFREGHDFHLRMLTAGAPLPVMKSALDGIEFAALKNNVIDVCKKLDFHVIIVDTVGDRHVKSLPFIAAIPQQRGFAPAQSGPVSRAEKAAGETQP